MSQAIHSSYSLLGTAMFFMISSQLMYIHILHSMQNYMIFHLVVKISRMSSLNSNNHVTVQFQLSAMDTTEKYMHMDTKLIQQYYQIYLL